MDKYLSEKLKIISFIAMILVVFLHSYNLTEKYNPDSLNLIDGYNAFIQFFLSQGIARVAVPIFFIISGYLFFINLNFKFQEFIIKYKKRGRSLLLPYLFWSIWWYLFFFILKLLHRPQKYLTNDIFEHFSVYQILDAIFIHNIIPYQLWFLRDLIIMVLFTPLIYLIIKNLRIFPLLLLLLIWIGVFDFNFIIFTNESILFFSIGAYLALIKKDFLVTIRNQKRYWIFTFIWIIIVLLKSSIDFENTFFLKVIIHNIGILTGVIAVWSLYDILHNKKTNKFIYSLSFFSFFIYAFHEPVLRIIKRGIFYIIKPSESISILVYFFAPIMTILLAILIGTFIKRKFPRFYGLITGGR